jgi:hypothetical protein
MVNDKFSKKIVFRQIDAGISVFSFAEENGIQSVRKITDIVVSCLQDRYV